jgi:hypothetical protein
MPGENSGHLLDLESHILNTSIPLNLKRDRVS